VLLGKIYAKVIEKEGHIYQAHTVVAKRPSRTKRRQLMDLDHLAVQRKSGKEKFHARGNEISADLLGFWKWSSSDLLNNAMRGVLAEYIVALDLGVAESTRVEWDPVDLKTKSGISVEVKSAAYLQSWVQKGYSRISFDIRRKYGWDEETNRRSGNFMRHAQVYVFCLLDNKDNTTIDPLNLDQWRFYILQTDILNRELGDQKTIGLRRLRSLDPVEARFGEIGSVIDNLMDQQPT
jgi:hypothetical protein